MWEIYKSVTKHNGIFPGLADLEKTLGLSEIYHLGKNNMHDYFVPQRHTGS